MRPLGRAALWTVSAGAALAALLGTLVPSDDPDMFHHLALGREIVRHGWPATEPFLYPLRGLPTGTPPYWLGSVVLYGWRAVAGEAGLSFLPAAVGALIALVLVADSAPRGGRHTAATLAAAALPIALAIETYRYRAVPRPEIFSALLLAVTMWAIRRFEDGRPRALLLFPVLAVLWTNLHPGTAVGLAALAILIACDAARGAAGRLAGRTMPGATPWRRIAIAGGVLVAGLAASAVNPAKVSPVAAAVRLAVAAFRLEGASASPADPVLADIVSSIVEMQGGGEDLWRSPLGALIALAALSLVLRVKSLRLREAVTLAAFAFLPFAAVRFAMFTAVVVAPIAARNLGEAVAAIPARLGRLPARGAAALALALAVIASAPLGALAPQVRFGTGIVRAAFPVRGADVLGSLGPGGRLFNTFHFGGYLEWRDLGPPFQDGRVAVRAEDAAAAMAGPAARALFGELDGRYRFDALLVAYPEPTAGSRFGTFDPDPSTWALVAFDDAGLLYLRRDGKYAEAAARDEFRHVLPANPLWALRPADPGAALAEYRRAVAESPQCFRCRYLLGELALALGRPEEAARSVAPVLEQAWGPHRVALESVAARAGAASR